MERLTKWNGEKYVLPQGRGVWREIAGRLAAYENTGLEPEEIIAMQTEQALALMDSGEHPAYCGVCFTAAIIVKEEGGNIPYVNPIDCGACVYAAEIKANADNPDVINAPGANHLVLAIYKEHWHVMQVSGYTPEDGFYTKLY